MFVISNVYLYPYSDDGACMGGPTQQYAKTEAEAVQICLKMLLAMEGDFQMCYDVLEYGRVTPKSLGYTKEDFKKEFAQGKALKKLKSTKGVKTVEDLKLDDFFHPPCSATGYWCINEVTETDKGVETRHVAGYKPYVHGE
ncbi:hypothetical protein KIPB_007692 [Kipferlia bialata]|uniref:Uncharacterized protein n=1 Tax=Kipferlia bialata TaxID=797122 RepID=A0A391NML9_9EUKA|nr:hypothetical protein KIPB_007692 [Kipferlia bialata]|eukprot:g7692.t1